MANPHDALFRATFAVPEHAEGLLSALLPPALARAIDWRTLVAQPGSFLDDELRASHGDLLFAARFSGQSLLLYVLLEHKSTADHWTALQLLGYVVRIWQRWRREHPEELHLPPVVPVVLHHGGRSWSAPTDMQGLLGLGPLDPEIAAEIHDLVPRFRFLLDDLSAQAEPELTDRALSATARLTLLFLQRIRGLPDAEALAAIVRWRDLVVSVAASPLRTARAALAMVLLPASDRCRGRGAA